MIVIPENAVYHRLVTHPGVASIVGFKVYPIAVPKYNTDGSEVTFPFIVYRRPNNRRESDLTQPILMPELSLQVACWALDYDSARALGDQVRLALNGHTGTIGNVTIHDMRLASEVDDYLDPSEEGAELPPAYEVRHLYNIRYTESGT